MNSDTERITGLTSEVLSKIAEVIFSFPSVSDAVIYGSRAKGCWKSFSDIDISLKGENVSHKDLTDIMLELEDLDIPFVVDVNRFSTITNVDLVDHINRLGISIAEFATPVN